MKEQNQAKEGWRARDVVYWLVMGLLAGFVNGLLGAGGGILIVFALASRLGYGEENSRDLYANALPSGPRLFRPLTDSSLRYSAERGR